MNKKTQNSIDYKITKGGRSRYYRIKKQRRNGKVVANVTRIKCAEFDDPSKNPSIGRVKPRVGDKVIIITKPYSAYKCVQGIVKDVLTNKEVHTRGHKVRLKNGVIGRTLKILKGS